MPFAAAVGAVGAIGAAAISASAGGNAGSTTTSNQTSPWSPQQPYLEYGFQGAQNYLNNETAAGPYQGNWYNTDNGEELNANSWAGDYAAGLGTGLVGNLGTSATSGLGALSPFISNASGMASGGTPLSSSLQAAGISGAQSLMGAQGSLSQIMRQGLSNPTQEIEDNAASYMNSAPVKSEIEAVNAPIMQTLTEQTVPGLNRTAAMGGDLNSSRAGMAEAIANQGAATAEGQADAAIENNAYDTGLSAATSLYGSGLSAATGAAADAGYIGEGAALGAGTQQLGANSQLGTAAGLGGSLASLTGTEAGNTYGLALGAGEQEQNDQNANNQALLAQYNYQQQYDQSMLGQYMGIVDGSYGSTTSGTTQYNLPPNYLGAALGGAMAGNALMGNSTSGLLSQNLNYGPALSSSTPGLTWNPYNAVGTETLGGTTANLGSNGLNYVGSLF